MNHEGGGGVQQGSSSAAAQAAAVARKKLFKLRNQQWANNTDYLFAAFVGLFLVIYLSSELRARLSRNTTKRPLLQRPVNWARQFVLMSFKTPMVGARVYAPMFVIWLLVLGYLVPSFIVHTEGLGLNRIGARTGIIASACLPPLFFLSMKNSPIGLLVGSSHEKLNIVHRWTGRTVVTIIALHAVFYCVSYEQNHKLEELKRTSNIFGICAFASMLLIAVTSIAIARRKAYEIFYVCHWLFTITTLVFVWYHDHATNQYVKASAGIILADLFLRLLRVLFTNPYAEAELAIVNEDLLTVTVPRPRFGPMHSWIPGSHAFLNIPTLSGLHQHHPFTIYSIPEDGHIQFIIKRQAGFTSTLHKRDAGAVRCLVDGSYGSLQTTRFGLYPHVLLIGGGVGITFVMPILRALLLRKNSVQHVSFVWSTNNSSTFSFFERELRAVQNALEASGSKIVLRIRLAFTQGLSASSSDVGEVSTETPTISASEKSVSVQAKPAASFEITRGRVALTELIQEELRHTERLAIGVCGPSHLVLAAKKAVSFELSRTSQDVFLYSEAFEW